MQTTRNHQQQRLNHVGTRFICRCTIGAMLIAASWGTACVEDDGTSEGAMSTATSATSGTTTAIPSEDVDQGVSLPLCLERPQQAQRGGCLLNRTVFVFTNPYSSSHAWIRTTCRAGDHRTDCCSPEIPDFNLEVSLPDGIVPGVHTIGANGVTARYTYLWEHAWGFFDAEIGVQHCECSLGYTSENIPIPAGTLTIRHENKMWIGKLEGLEPWVLPIEMDMTPSCGSILGE